MEPMYGPQNQPPVEMQPIAGQAAHAAAGSAVPIASTMDRQIDKKDNSESIQTKARQLLDKLGQFCSNPKVQYYASIAVLLLGLSLVATFLLKEPPEGQDRPIELLGGGVAVAIVGMIGMSRTADTYYNQVQQQRANADRVSQRRETDAVSEEDRKELEAEIDAVEFPKSSDDIDGIMQAQLAADIEQIGTTLNEV